MGKHLNYIRVSLSLCVCKLKYVNAYAYACVFVHKNITYIICVRKSKAKRLHNAV